ncbi:MAG: hypothetical protein Greene041619_813 [Candidatus Peregrinibacteria bacterium Greene0416_19]|nr:MAG: hypothetical protein Greene041619_813 [Candidatus Peregrinibacteria bacterium Greene0416_19]
MKSSFLRRLHNRSGAAATGAGHGCTHIELLLVTRLRFQLRRGFTLIELLLVIGIIAILASIVIIAINPIEQFKKAHDGERLSELNSIHKALRQYEVQAKSPDYGPKKTVSVSIPDTSATCANLGLPALPAGWSYRCVTAASVKKTDGTGWIPVNFDALSAAPLTEISLDPTNTVAGGLYYTYVGGSWKLTASFESAKMINELQKDGGPDPALFEIGSDLALAPFARGLTGYWKLDEVFGPSAADSSGNAYAGTLSSVGTAWVPGKVGGGGLSFDGTNYTSFVSIPQVLQGSSPFTAMAWIKPTNPPLPWQTVLGEGCSGFDFGVNVGNLYFGRNCGAGTFYLGPPVGANVWVHAAMTWDGTTNHLFANGVKTVGGTNSFTHTVLSLGSYNSASERFNGIIDDVRVYNRVLSDTEIKFMYDVTK